MRIIVTGGAGGIGREIVDVLSQAGHDLLSCDLAHDAPAVPPSWKGGEPLRCRLDITDDAQVKTLFESVAAQARVDAVIHCAGRGIFKPFEALDADNWRALLETNVVGAMLVSQAAARVMQRTGGGRLVHFGSVANTQPLPGSAAYGASKAALAMLCRSMNYELHAAAIRVTFLTLGAVHTPIWESRPGFAATDMLPARDAALAVKAIVESPLHVRIDEMTLLPPKGIL